MIIDRKLFSFVRMFYDNPFIYCEHIDLCYRLKKLDHLNYHALYTKMYHENRKVSDKNFF